MKKIIEGTRREFVTRSTVGALGAAFAAGLPVTAMAADAGSWGKPRKCVWVPQALGDWDTAMQVGMRDFCGMVGWSYQRLGNPDYSPENHVEQVNNAIAGGADVIITELESPALIAAFQRGIDAGVTMQIADQGIDEEAKNLGIGIIGEDGFNAGIINGTQAATFGQKLTGKKEGVIVLGNGNPGSDLIEKRQAGSKVGIENYNKANGTNFTFDPYPDSEFGDITESVQKWTAKIDLYKDKLVAAIGTGNGNPIVQAFQEHGYKPGQIAIGSPDIPPSHQKAISEGWMQWGEDQHFYLMGFYAASSAWAKAERHYAGTTIHTGGELVRKEDLKVVTPRTDLWIAKAKEYGIM
ncbi:MAG: substrate-binding domain-containing protein [Methylobacteriaceae bacterium]|nr:substrate-binding domain-containing protein [Methylobacteriaceae bacterium]MBV9218358.1 substrate-binding domain-containing protein [Methylobacteriaceae bacterium]MBV9635780.1 substrate-binding domain-containing protein [Methylobacteriaceae bacterium]MBV9702059.1 substrate-binding domain-containing protein [Methylobacteriaceae bacterium]